MRDASSNLITRMATGSNTLARLWRIERKDGTVQRFTDHDEDITITDGTYKSTPSFTPQAVVSTAGRGIGNTELPIVFTGDSSTGFDREQLIRGVYDDASVFIYLVDWLYPSYGTMTILAGSFGTIAIDNNVGGTVSISGLLSKLDKILGERYSAECRVDLGSIRCGISLDDGVGGSNAKAILSMDVASGGFFHGHPAGQALAGETVTIGTKTYTWRVSVSTIANEVKIGNTGADSIKNLVAAVNAGAGSGTVYGSLTTANADATGSANGGRATFTAIVSGAAGNGIVSTTTMTRASFNGATFQSGADPSRLRTTGTISAVTSSSKITITPDLPIAAGFLNLGMIVWDELTSNSGLSMEILVDGAGTGDDHLLTLALAMPFTPLVGDTVVLFAGCDKLKVTCDTRFRNLVNFQGEPGIPGSDAQQVIG
jgi:uncharacterized phage protein (TIGR02218 family)